MPVVAACFGGNNTAGPIDVATARSASGTASGRMDFESETFAVCVTGPNTPALKAEGHDGSEDGTGRGQPVIAIQERAICENPLAGPDGVGVRTDNCAYTLEARTVPQAVAFEPRCARNGREMPEEIVPPLKAQSGMTGKGDSAPCVAFPIQECHVSRANIKGTGTGLGGESDPMVTLQSAQPHGVATAMQVRRLTPVECERLQGFPDGYTAIPWRNKPAGDCPDGPRYKALGNSMAVPVMRWIGWRISMTGV